MDASTGFEYSMNGFLDYTRCFGDYDVVWTITGCLIFVGTLISYQPQNAAIIGARSSFGINPFMTFVTNLGQGFIFFNILCLHVSDFSGLFMPKANDPQHAIKVLSTFLTVGNMMMDWYTFKFVYVLNFIFIDIEPRMKRGKKVITREKFLGRFLYGLSVVIENILFLIFITIGTRKGFQSKEIRTYADICSIASTVCFSVQYIPQMITTCCLKDRGSYSIITLTILLVGTSINFCFMLFGQGEDWTTVFPVGVTIVEQLILFIICVYFMVIKYRERKYGVLLPQIGDSLSRMEPKYTSTSEKLTFDVTEDNSLQSQNTTATTTSTSSSQT